jgi:hypothetical protein
MFCQKNFLIEAELIFVSGFACIHFVKYSTATTMKYFLELSFGLYDVSVFYQRFYPVLV